MVILSYTVKQQQTLGNKGPCPDLFHQKSIWRCVFIFLFVYGHQSLSLHAFSIKHILTLFLMLYPEILECCAVMDQSQYLN